MEKSTVKMTIIFASLINITGFVLTMIYGTEGFDIRFYIVWGLSLIWLTLFVCANCFYNNSKNKCKSNKRTARY